jgi:hypothetical protein
VATLALADKDRQDLGDLLHRYGRQHTTRTVTIADDGLTATVRYTSRIPRHGHLLEAFVLAVHPAAQKPKGAGPQPLSEPCRSPEHDLEAERSGYPRRTSPSGTGGAR